MKKLVMLGMALMTWGSFSWAQSSCGYQQLLGLTKDSPIIVVGTIKKLGAVVNPETPVSNDTLVFHVDSSLVDPWKNPGNSVGGIAGTDITAKVKNPSDFKANDQVLLYAQGWILGQSISVSEIAHFPTSCSQVAAVAVKNLPDELLRDRLTPAALVISGDVLKTYADPNYKPTMSEHDPAWQIAEVQVSQFLKGASAQTVLVKFPGSFDIMWARVPKFKVGQKGVWILQKDSKASREQYTALDKRDFQALSELQRIKDLLAN